MGRNKKLAATTPAWKERHAIPSTVHQHFRKPQSLTRALSSALFLWRSTNHCARIARASFVCTANSDLAKILTAPSVARQRWLLSMKTSSHNHPRLRNNFAHVVLKCLINRGQHVLLLPAKERVNESTKLPKAQFVIVGSAPAPTLDTEVHLPPTTGVPTVVPPCHCRKNDTVPPAVSSGRERASLNQWRSATTLSAWESERYSITVATKTFKTLTKMAADSPDITRVDSAQHSKHQPNNQIRNCQTNRLPVKEFNETEDSRPMIPMTR